MIVEVREPFHLGLTVGLLQRRPANPLDRFEGGRWLRLLDRPPGLLAVESAGPGRLRIAFGKGRVPAAVAAQVRRALGLDVDLTPFHRAAAADPLLAPLLPQIAGMRPPRFLSLFESFLGVIPFQQLSLDAGMATFGRLVRRYGRAENGCRAAPTAEAIAAADPNELRSLGLAATRAQALQGAARACLDGILVEEELERLPTPLARKRLLALRGIGPWSADLILLRGLGRLDLFPQGDVGVARGLRSLFGDAVDPRRLAAACAPQQGMVYFLALAGWLLAHRSFDL